MAALETRGLSVHTVRAYGFDLVVLLRWLALDNRCLTELKTSDLLAFIRTQRQHGAQPKSINRRLCTTRLFFRFCTGREMEDGPGVSLPATHYKGRVRDRKLGLHIIRSPRRRKLMVKTPRKLVEPLTREQVMAFLRNLHRYRDVAIVYLMLLCGLRSREVLRLGRRDVSLLERRMRVWGKGAKERNVPLADLAAAAVEQYLKHERPWDAGAEALFVCLQGKRRGQAMTPEGLRSLFRGRRRLPDLANANPHRFRHTFGADMARSGVSLPVLQKLMGHADHHTTLRYINLSLDDIADAYRIAAAQIRKRYDTKE